MEIFPYSKKRLHLELTGNCNLRCIYCYQSPLNEVTKIKNELNLSQIFDIIDQSKCLGCETITLTGGEPFAHPDIYKILDYCKTLCVEILTNSVLLNEEKIKHLGKTYPQIKTIKISIDGLHGHNINRYPSDYRQIINNFRAFKKYTKCKLIANTMITKHTLKELPELYKMLKKIPIETWRIDVPFLAGRYKKTAPNCAAQPKAVALTLNKLLKKYFLNKKPFKLEIFNLYKSNLITDKLFKFNTNLHPCSYDTWSTLCVKTNGDITFCPSLTKPIANILNQNQQVDLLQGIKIARKNDFFKIKVKQIKKCVNCKYLNICGGGCRADSLYWKGKLITADPVACTYMKLMEKYIIPILPKNESKYLMSLIKTKWPLP